MVPVVAGTNALAVWLTLTHAHFAPKHLFQDFPKDKVKSAAEECGLTGKYITQALNRYS
jgi:hypothetical protein